MQMVQPITLPKTAPFYTTPFTFEVSLVAGACKTYIDLKSKSFPLELDENMQRLLTNYGLSHQATIEEIANASVQFFESSTRLAATLDFIELRFMQTYDFGCVMTCGDTDHDPDKLGPASHVRSMRHSEVLKKTTEMFGYGLALHYVAKVLGVPTDWFKFILSGDAR